MSNAALNFATSLAQRFGLTEAQGATFLRHAAARRLADPDGAVTSELAALVVLAMGSCLPVADAIKSARNALDLRCDFGSLYEISASGIKSQTIAPEWPREPLRA